MAAAVVAQPVVINGNNLSELKKLYLSKIHKVENNYLHPYVQIAMIVSAAAITIFASSIYISIIGLVTFLCTVFLNRKFAVKELTEIQKIRNEMNQEIVDKLTAPGFFEYCQPDLRNLSSAGMINWAFQQFQNRRPIQIQI